MIPRHLKIMAGLLLGAAVVLGFYAWSFKHNAERATEQAEKLRTGLPMIGNTSQVDIYVADDASGQLTRKTVSIPLPEENSERTRQILRNLLLMYQNQPSSHVIGEGADVDSVFFVNDKLVVLNFNSPFADKHPSGVLTEELTITSIVATLRLNNPQVEKVKFLVDGKERETLAGHADLKNPLDAAAVNQLAKDLP